jgi:hypothetical protein
MRVRVSDIVTGVIALAAGALVGGWTASSIEWPVTSALAAPPASAAPGAPTGHAGHDHGEHAKAAPSPDASPAAKAQKAQKAQKAAPAGAVYACPMHPEVTSSRKEDRCRKCGMFLEKRP